MFGKRFLLPPVVFCLLWLAGCGGSSSNSQKATITISPTSANVPAGSSQQFTATVTGPPITAVTWQVNDVTGGNSAAGIISGGGLYTAPSSIPSPATVTIKAISQVDSSLTASAQATVTAPVVVTLTPNQPTTVAATKTEQFTATVSGTSNKAVTWQVNGIAGGNGSVGTISNTGLYTAPAMVPNPSMVHVGAVSQAVSSSSASAPVTVTVLVTVSPLQETIGVRGNRQFTATVVGSTTTTVTWTVSGGGTNDGTIDANGYYFAPTAPTSGVNVTATADADGTVSAPATITVQANDPLGTISNVQTVPCPGGGETGGTMTCSSMVVSCDGVADINAYVKVNAPLSTPFGTVIFGTGTGGSSLYDADTSFQGGGLMVVDQVLNKGGFTTAQVSFGVPFVNDQPNGWLQGPGGVRRLACRYATVADWIYKHVHNSNTSKPMCATGNSGGGAAVAYALSEYGLANGTPPEISMAEITSAPPMARIDEGCSAPSACQSISSATPCSGQSGNLQTTNLCYSQGDAAIIDPAYATPACTNSINGNPPSDAATVFESDSVVDGPSVKFTFPKTYVNLVFGGQDASAAVPQGVTWGDSISSTNSGAPACVLDAPHAIPSVTDGANTIASDINNNCAPQ